MATSGTHQALGLWSPLQWKTVPVESTPRPELLVAARAFGLPAEGSISLLRSGTNCDAFRYTCRAGAFVLKKGKTYTRADHVRGAAVLYGLLRELGIFTKCLIPSRTGDFIHPAASGPGFWECSRLIRGRPPGFAAAVTRGLGAAVASLHRGLARLGDRFPVTNTPYWRRRTGASLVHFAEQDHPGWQACSISRRAREHLGEAAAWCASLKDESEVDPIHGDLHLDNILVELRTGKVAIFDFDVARRERGGITCEMGILWHRLVRKAMTLTVRSLSEVCGAVLEHLLSGYEEVRTIDFTPARALRAALLESLRKLASSVERSRVRAEPWARFARHHLVYVSELTAMAGATRAASLQPVTWPWQTGDTLPRRRRRG